MALPPVRIFNSLTLSLDPLALEKAPLVKWYTCGPTVYDASHLGHARNYVAQDVIRRILETYFRYDVELVMNITDIDDKIIVRARELGVAPEELTKRYEADFFRVMDQLNVRRPTTLTRVTEYVPNIVAYIQRIIDNGFAYVAPSGSVYFDLEEYVREHKYGLLRSANELVAAESDSDKRHVQDFALWKASKPNEPAWPSPWGPGRPGWHIECSVMATAILGPTFDLHSGGEDLRFPHHENEIAQAVAYNADGDTWVGQFLHTGHLHIEGHKMAKSLKNFITIDQALETYTPRQMRILFLIHHYRDTLNYGTDTMEIAVATDRGIQEFLANVRYVLDQTDSVQWLEKEVVLEQKFEDIRSDIALAFATDFDTPKVLDGVRQLIKLVYSYLPGKPNTYLVRSIRDYIIDVTENVLGLDFTLSVAPASDLVPRVLDSVVAFRDDIKKLLKDPAMNDIRALKRELFRLSDRFRDESLPAIGVRLDDSASGGIWKIES